MEETFAKRPSETIKPLSADPSADPNMLGPKISLCGQLRPAQHKKKAHEEDGRPFDVRCCVPQQSWSWQMYMRPTQNGKKAKQSICFHQLVGHRIVVVVVVVVVELAGETRARTKTERKQVAPMAGVFLNL